MCDSASEEIRAYEFKLVGEPGDGHETFVWSSTTRIDAPEPVRVVSSGYPSSGARASSLLTTSKRSVAPTIARAEKGGVSPLVAPTLLLILNLTSLLGRSLGSRFARTMRHLVGLERVVADCWLSLAKQVCRDARAARLPLFCYASGYLVWGSVNPVFPW
jgi:hypothetical protein